MNTRNAYLRRPDEKDYAFFFIGAAYAITALCGLIRIGSMATSSDHLPSASFAVTLFFCAVLAIGVLLMKYAASAGVLRAKERNTLRSS